MKCYWISIISLLSLLCACETAAPESTKPPTTGSATKGNADVNFFQQKATGIEKYRFRPLLDSSYYLQRDSFVMALQQHYGIPSEHDLLERQVKQLYGARDSVFWLRFSNRKTVPDCPHPLQEQHFIFDHKGQLLYQNYVHSAQFLDNAIDSLPVYLTVEHNCEGEGQHHAYVVQQGQLLDVLNVLFENTPQTVDAKEDSSVFQGGKLLPVVIDANEDGYADLVLQGKRLKLYSRSGKRFSVQRPYHREQITYYFLYQPAKEVFVFAPTFVPARR